MRRHLLIIVLLLMPFAGGTTLATHADDHPDHCTEEAPFTTYCDLGMWTNVRGIGVLAHQVGVSYTGAIEIRDPGTDYEWTARFDFRDGRSIGGEAIRTGTEPDQVRVECRSLWSTAPVVASFGGFDPHDVHLEGGVGQWGCVFAGDHL